MQKFTYQFIEVAAKAGLKAKPGDAFEECKRIIFEEAKQGWQLKQIVTPFNEKMGIYGALGYQIIFEKPVD